MALILGIETATEVCSVALGKEGSCLAELNNLEGNEHAAQLHVMIQQLMQENGFTLKELDAIVVSKGPGSYTGLRVGVSSAKGLAYALQLPLLAVDSLSSLCNRLWAQINPENALYVPMIDARRMEVYTALYEASGELLLPIEAKIIDNQSYGDLLSKRKMVFFGNGSAKCKTVLEHPNAFFVEDFHCGAMGLLKTAEEKFQQHDFENLAYFEPFYLKDFVGTTPKQKV